MNGGGGGHRPSLLDYWGPPTPLSSYSTVMTFMFARSSTCFILFCDRKTALIYSMMNSHYHANLNALISNVCCLTLKFH